MNLRASKPCAILSGMAGLLNMMRKAMETSGQSRYRISKETGIAESVLSRFANGKAVLTVETAERLADHLGLEIVLRPKRGRGTRKGG
jgi:ribosome-binding protein aMBF1 (putative translation factor)